MDLEFPGSWGAAYIEKTPPLVIRTTFAQVANHMADVFFACDQDVIAPLFDLASDCLHMQMQRKYVDVRALTWLRAKRRYLRGDFQGFLALSPLLISDGRSNTESLWFDVLLDLVSVLERMGEQSTELAREVAQWIARCGFGPQGLPERCARISSDVFYHRVSRQQSSG